MRQGKALKKIKELRGVVKLSTIIDIIQYENFYEDVLEKIEKPIEYCKDDYNNLLVPLRNLFVDLSYQRELKILNLIKRLIDSREFIKSPAGFIDIAIRPDTRSFVWDGFHRAILALMAGYENLPASIYYHPKGFSQEQCREKEANFFVIRNANISKLTPDEVFKGSVATGDAKALKQLSYLKTCRLNILDTNPDKTASTFKSITLFSKYAKGLDSRLVFKTKHEIELKYFQEASNMIREIWQKSDEKIEILAYLLCGLALFLKLNSEVEISSLDIKTIKKLLKAYVEKHKIGQGHFSHPAKSSARVESVVRNLVKKVFDCDAGYNDNGKEVEKLLNHININDPDDDMIWEDYTADAA